MHVSQVLQRVWKALSRSFREWMNSLAGFVLFAGRASVRPGFWRAFVAHPVAFGVFPQLADLESLVARGAGTNGILLLEMTRAADDGSRREVPQLALLFASGA